MGRAEPSLSEALTERFAVVGLAGRGGMGEVYRAVHRASGEHVALKIMPATEEGRQRFEREASAIESLGHGSIVRYREHGELDDGRVFLAMEWVEGESLGKRVRRERIRLHEALVLGAKLARALAAVHGAGLVHRDVKPGNVILRGGDATQPVLLDFGLVKPVTAQGITNVGLAVGTPGYMSPEQARGSLAVDARADVFALACVLYRCITGDRPFPGANVTAVLTKLLFDTPAPMAKLEPRVPPELDALIARMLTKDPDERPRDAAAIAAELEELAEREAPSRPSITSEARALTPEEQRPVSVVVVADEAHDAPTMVVAVESSHVLLRPVESGMANDAVVALAESLGGVAETLANGAVVVVFQGATNARDQCVRAARCALRLKALAPLKTVALVSGRAQSSGDSIVGEAVDRAMGALHGASPKGVRVDDASAQLLEPRFEVAGDVMTSERGEGLTARTLLGAPTPCVGREVEMSAVLGALDQCVEDGGARVVAVTAEAGVGKSRLASEVVARALEAHEDLAVWLARGDPLFDGSTLALVGRMLTEVVGLSASDSVETSRERLRARVAEHVPAEYARSVAEFLGEICGVPFDAESSLALRAARSDAQLMSNQLRTAFEQLVVAEASARPLLIVVEDLHWADALSVAYLQKAAMHVSSGSMLLLALSRPEGAERFPSLFADAMQLSMRPLSPKAATSLARAVLGDAGTAENIQRIVELAAGNAFYLEELIRAVADGHGDLPETIVLMAQARLSALDPDARRVLRGASIFGEAFSAADVAALEGTEAAALWLQPLVEREVLVRAGDGSLSFRHALLREAAYASLTDDDRVLGHKLAARQLERRGVRNAMSVADHHARGGEPRAAATAYVRAAEQSLEAGDFDGPAVAFERARACGAEGKVLGQLEGLAARAAWLRGDMAESERLGREALGNLGSGDPVFYDVIADLGNALQGRLDHAGIEELSHMLLTRPAPKPASPSYARALSLCYTLVIQNTPHAPLAARLSAAVDAVTAEPGHDALIEARLAVARAFGAVVRRNPNAAELFELAASRMEEVGRGEIARMQRNAMGTALGWLGDWEKAAEMLAAIPEAGGRAWLWTRVTLGWSLAQLGSLDEATATVERVVGAGGDDAFLVVECHLTLARIEILRGLPRDAAARVAVCLGDATLPKPIVARLHAVGFEAASAFDAERARAHGRAVEAALEDSVALVEDAVYVRQIGAESKLAGKDVAGARKLLDDALELIRGYALQIEDARARERFLRRVRENARVVELARSLEMDDPSPENH